MKKKNYTNLLGWVSLIVSLLMVLAWLYKSVFEDKELVGLEPEYIFYSFGASIIFFLMPEDWIKSLVKRLLNKFIGPDSNE